MRHSPVTLISLFLFATAFVLSGCSSNTSMKTDPQAGPPPAVANVGEQVNGVAPNRALYVQFNEAMDPSTINGNTVTVANSAGTAAAGTVTYDSNFDVAEFQPDPALQAGASYTLTVTSGAKSSQDVPLSAAYTYNFTTRSATDKSPIYVKSVTPAANATCVAAATPITITFSEGADVNTLTSANIVITGPGSTPLAAQLSYNVANATVTLTPSASLPSGTITVTIKNVADAAGVVMASPYAWTFSTTCTSGGGGNGGGNGGNGGTGSATVQFQAPLLSFGTVTYSVKGQVSIDTAGNITIQLTGAGASTQYFAQFCPAVEPGSVNTSVPCVALTNITTDSSGNASTTFKYPEGGEWAGDFYLSASNSNTTAYQTFLAPGVNNETYTALLLPAKDVNGGVDTTVTTQDPLTSGTVTYSKGSLKFSVTGALPDTTYSTAESETTTIESSGTYYTGSFTTDASGNGSLTTPLSDSGGDMFQALPPKDAGFIGGFSIPLQ
jgi:methionine-rich copper-binding protein CopC